MSPVLTFLILCAVSAALMSGATFLPRPFANVCAVLMLLWLAAALPLLYFTMLGEQYVLLFYLVSGAVGLLLWLGGDKK